jgi:hypothetical protein
VVSEWFLVLPLGGAAPLILSVSFLEVPLSLSDTFCLSPMFSCVPIPAA